VTGHGDQVVDDLQDEDESPAADSSAGGIGFAAIVTIVGLVFFLQSLQIHSQAGLWPRMLSIALVVFAGTQTITAILARRKFPLQATRGQQPNGSTYRRVFTAVWLSAYCIAAQMIGFGPAMLVFVPIYMWVMGYRKPLWILIVTGGFAAGLSLMFDTVANVPIWSQRL